MPFPWDEAAGCACGLLRLSPEQFWAMTPAELAMLARALAPRVDMPTRQELGRLMARYPDRTAGPDGRRRDD